MLVSEVITLLNVSKMTGIDTSSFFFFLEICTKHQESNSIMPGGQGEIAQIDEISKPKHIEVVHKKTHYKFIKW